MGSVFSEGDYIRTDDGLFFAVKGGRHSDELVVAILRYIPDEKGERVQDGKRHCRVYDIVSTTKFLAENYPDYLNYIDWLGLRLQSVPTSKIVEVYKPTQRLQDILARPESRLEEQIAHFVERLSDASGVSSASFGVSGSLLIGFETVDSDIDLNVYGEMEGRKVYDAFKQLRSIEDWVSPYDADSIELVLKSRWGDTGLDLDRLRAVECDKVLHGLVYGVDYFIRLLADEDNSTSIPIKTAIISATVTDASHGIFTPCTYRIEKALISGESSYYPISELKSYRGKFTEQVRAGDEIQARGTLEKVTHCNATYYRLILGGKGDYLIPV
jgi:predicted nucleotidyltransferase